MENQMIDLFLLIAGFNDYVWAINVVLPLIDL